MTDNATKTKASTPLSEKEKYYRAGIAMPVARKPEFDRRMEALGLKTVGELVSMFATMPGVVEALAPAAAEFRAQAVRSKIKMSDSKRKTMVEQLSGLSQQELADLMAQAGLQVVPAGREG